MKTLAATALTLCLVLVGCADSAGPEPDASLFTEANTATAKVDGMTCSACEGAVCSAIEEVEGVEAVTADAGTGQVKIAIKDGATLDTKAVEQAVAKADFKFQSLTLPEPPKDDASQAEQPGQDEPASE
ncbi:MAG: heavy-metal-associated domain-containing protein [Phycisphaeraceae bacterium]